MPIILKDTFNHFRKEVFKMSKYNTIDVWNHYYGKKEDVKDYAGKLMKNLHVEILIVIIILH